MAMDLLKILFAIVVCLAFGITLWSLFSDEAKRDATLSEAEKDEEWVLRQW